MSISARSRSLPILLLALVVCAQSPKPPAEPAFEPIPLGPKGSLPIIFTHVVTRIPSGTLLGVARLRGRSTPFDEIRHTGSQTRSPAYNIAITDELRRWGYNVLDESDALFDPTSSMKIRYQLAAILHSAALDFEYEQIGNRDNPTLEGVGTAEVELELQVFDAVEKKVVFERRYTGRGVDDGMKPAPIVPAVVNAVTRALEDQEFVDLVAADSPASTQNAVATKPIPITYCKTRQRLRLPADLERILDSVVMVQAGSSLGTGVIISEDGYVLTAAHVVFDLDEVFVKLNSGPQIPTPVVRRDAARDVALLKLPGSGYYCAAPQRGAENLATGSDIFSINVIGPKQIAPSVSRGVVSGYPEVDGRRYIQTDASVNPGSSGGPLFNRTGIVSGIVVEKAIGAGIEGLAVAVPPQSAIESLGIHWEQD